MSDHGRFTSGELRNPSGVWYPLSLSTDSDNADEQWHFDNNYTTSAGINAAMPDGTYTFVLNSPLGTTTTQFSYVRSPITPVITPTGIADGATGISTTPTFHWNAINDSNPDDSLEVEVDGPNGGDTFDDQQFDTTTTSYSPPTLDASSNYSLSLRLGSWSDNGNNADGFDFSSGVTNETDLLFRTAGTSGGAPDLGLSAVTFPNGTIHPGDWIKLPVTGGNSGGNAVGKSGNTVVPIQYQAVLAATKTWGAAGNIVISQGQHRKWRFHRRRLFWRCGSDDGPTRSHSFFGGSRKLLGRNQNRFYRRGLRQHRQHHRLFRHANHYLRQWHDHYNPAGQPECHRRAKPVYFSWQLHRIQHHRPLCRGCELGRWHRGQHLFSRRHRAIPATDHTFAASGTDSVTITVTDWNGEATKSSTVNVTVTPAPPPPPLPTGALEVWAGNTNLNGDSDSLFSIDQSGYTLLGVTNAQNANVLFSTSGQQYNYFVVVSRGQVQVDSVQGSDSTFLSNIDFSGNVSQNGNVTTIGTQENSNGTYAGYAEFANVHSWTGLTIQTGSMGLMLQGQILRGERLSSRRINTPYDYDGELRVADNGLITSGEVRNPSGAWYPLSLSTDSDNADEQWHFENNYTSSTSLNAAIPNGTYTFVLNSPLGTTTTQFSYVRSPDYARAHSHRHCRWQRHRRFHHSDLPLERHQRQQSRRFP